MILVIGDTMLDILILGPIERLSPEAPWAPVVLAGEFKFRGGGAAFVARTIKQLGEDVFLLGACGDDVWGRLLEDTLDEELGEDLFELWRSDCTTVKLSVSSADACVGRHQLVRADRDATRVASVSGACAAYFEDPDISCVVVADYAKGMLQSCRGLGKAPKAMRLASEGRFIGDAKPQHVRLLPNGSIVTPNWKEACEMVGRPLRRPRGRVAMSALTMDAFNAGTGGPCIVTFAEDGVAWTTEGETTDFARCEDPNPHKVSVSGAGDVFSAALAVALNKGDNLSTAIVEAERVARYFVHTGEVV